jgi:Uma2 family endonuclease
MTALPKQKWTPESYLEFERASETKHEYLDGEVYEMVGGSPRHNLIMVRTLGSLDAQLANRPCFVYPSDQRVRVKKAKFYTYPDISVVCGEPVYEDDTLLNPNVIIEVLSPSTEQYDRGRKLLYYQLLESLQSYLLISQDSPRIEHYERRSEGAWLYTVTAGLDASLELPAIDCTLRLRDVYQKVTFDAEEPGVG